MQKELQQGDGEGTPTILLLTGEGKKIILCAGDRTERTEDVLDTSAGRVLAQRHART